MKPSPFNPDNWTYEFNAWKDAMGGLPDQLLASHDKSEQYEMDRCHVFRIRPGRFVTIFESGCSCYEPENATIEVYGDEASAMASYSKWFDPTGVAP
jgi:hypothetical protein